MDSSTRQIWANGLNFDSVSLEMYASRIFFVWSEGGPRLVGAGQIYFVTCKKELEEEELYYPRNRSMEVEGILH